MKSVPSWSWFISGMGGMYLLLSSVGRVNDGDKVTLPITERKPITIVSLDKVPSDEMVLPPDDAKEDCPNVLLAACEAAMPGAVKIERAYRVERTPDGVGVQWALCRNVLCVKAVIDH